MNLELQQLDLRYEKLRTRKPEAERKLVASLAEIGQQVPMVVVQGEAPAQFVLVDGYKRVRGAAPARAGPGGGYLLGSERGRGADPGPADAHGRGRDGWRGASA